MTSENKVKGPSKKNKALNEIEIEQQDLLNVFFDKSSSQFESQFFLSRKRMLNAENGQNEISELLKSKLKALDMMLLILMNNKNILKESDLSCCEVLNNLLCISKKDKSYGEHIYSKIKAITLYILKNQLFLKEKNIESYKVIIKFLITLLNIKFDNGYFKQVLEIISSKKEVCILFMNELFDKLFKGRNITIKLKEMKYILKTTLFDENIKKFYDFFDIMEKILSYAHQKDSGGCRTSFQLNQIVFLLQYLIDILNIKEINNTLPEKDIFNAKLLKILNDFKNSLNEFVDKNDFEQDKNKLKKKELEALNEKIKRKRVFFMEMLNFLNKFKNHFKKDLGNKEYSQIFEEINNLYKNTISVKYTVLTITKANKDKKNFDKNNNKDFKDENEDKKNNNNKSNKLQKEEDKERDNNDKENYKDKNDDEEIEENEDEDDNDNNKKDNKNEEFKDNNEKKNVNKGIELDEENEEKEINNDDTNRRNKKINNKYKNKENIKNKDIKDGNKIEKKDKNEKKGKKNNKDTKKESKNKKKKEK